MKFPLENHARLLRLQHNRNVLYNIYKRSPSAERWNKVVRANSRLYNFNMEQRLKNQRRRRTGPVLQWRNNVNSNRNTAARKIQKRYLNYKAITLLKALKSLPAEIRNSIAQSALRRRSA
jgi:hypothetical protein